MNTIQTEFPISGEKLSYYERVYEFAVKDIGKDRLVKLAQKQLNYHNIGAREIIFFGSIIKLMYRERKAFISNNVEYGDMFGPMWLIFISALNSYDPKVGSSIQSYSMLAWRCQARTYAMCMKSGPIQLKPSNCKIINKDKPKYISFDSPVTSNEECVLTVKDTIPDVNYESDESIKEALNKFYDNGNLNDLEKNVLKSSLIAYNNGEVINQSVAGVIAEKICKSPEYLRHIKYLINKKYKHWSQECLKMCRC